MFSIPGIIAWLATSRTGRAIAAAGALAFAIGIAVLRVFNAGKAAERVKQDRQSLDNLRDRRAIDEDVRNLGPADLDNRLKRWVRPDE